MRTALVTLWGRWSAGSTVLREPPSPGAEPLRHALGVTGARSVHRVHGVELAVHDSAAGSPTNSTQPVLVCLHAIGHGGGDFALVEAAMAGRWRVVSFDWPAHGFSGPDPAPASAAHYTDLFAALVDSLGLERFFVLGNSIGGAVALRYAAAHPKRVRGLVLANPGGLDPGASGWLGRWFIGGLVDHFEQGVRHEARFAQWFADFYSDILVTPEAAARKAAIVAAGYESAPALVQAWRSFAEPEAFLGAWLPSIRVPALVTWATRDRWVSWSRNRQTIDRLPNKKVVFFDAGHSAFLEAPAAFAAELSSFLHGFLHGP